MLKNKRINCKAKGSCGERNLVNWLKERDIHSARRTQQFNGKDGLSDVVAPGELPHFHIESKAVKSPILTRSIAKKWAEQMKRDCPDGQHPVLFMKPNNSDMSVFFFLETIRHFRLSSPNFLVTIEESFNPAKTISGAKLTQRVNSRLFPGMKLGDVLAIYEIEKDLEFFAMEADDALAHMLNLEMNYAAKGNSLPKKEDQNTIDSTAITISEA